MVKYDEWQLILNYIVAIILFDVEIFIMYRQHYTYSITIFNLAMTTSSGRGIFVMGKRGGDSVYFSVLII